MSTTAALLSDNPEFSANGYHAPERIKTEISRVVYLDFGLSLPYDTAFQAAQALVVRPELAAALSDIDPPHRVQAIEQTLKSWGFAFIGAYPVAEIVEAIQPEESKLEPVAA